MAHIYRAVDKIISCAVFKQLCDHGNEHLSNQLICRLLDSFHVAPLYCQLQFYIVDSTMVYETCYCMGIDVEVFLLELKILLCLKILFSRSRNNSRLGPPWSTEGSRTLSPLWNLHKRQAQACLRLSEGAIIGLQISIH